MLMNSFFPLGICLGVAVLASTATADSASKTLTTTCHNIDLSLYRIESIVGDKIIRRYEIDDVPYEAADLEEELRLTGLINEKKWKKPDGSQGTEATHTAVLSVRRRDGQNLSPRTESSQLALLVTCVVRQTEKP